MTRRCKDCVFANNNKLREVIKDVISCVNNEHTRLEAENAKLKEILEKIKNICKPVLKANTIEKLEGKHLTGKYNLAKEIMEVLKDE